MKAHEILMFLLIFNLVLWLLGGYGLNLYRIGVYGNHTGIESGTSALEQQDVSSQSDIGLAFLFEISGVAFMTIITGVASMAVIGYLARSVPSPQSVIYGAFAGLFWTSYIKTVQVFYNIAIDVPGIFFVILLVFSAITVYSFIFGFAQIVTGSWRYMK